MEVPIEILNGLAGVAALVNSLLMWPTIRYLKGLEPRVAALEEASKKNKSPTSRARKRGRI